jgi:hypothetical protein
MTSSFPGPKIVAEEEKRKTTWKQDEFFYYDLLKKKTIETDNNAMRIKQFFLTLVLGSFSSLARGEAPLTCGGTENYLRVQGKTKGMIVCQKSPLKSSSVPSENQIIKKPKPPKEMNVLFRVTPDQQNLSTLKEVIPEKTLGEILAKGGYLEIMITYTNDQHPFVMILPVFTGNDVGHTVGFNAKASYTTENLITFAFSGSTDLSTQSLGKASLATRKGESIDEYTYRVQRYTVANIYRLAVDTKKKRQPIYVGFEGSWHEYDQLSTSGRETDNFITDVQSWWHKFNKDFTKPLYVDGNNKAKGIDLGSSVNNAPQKLVNPEDQGFHVSMMLGAQKMFGDPNCGLLVYTELSGTPTGFYQQHLSWAVGAEFSLLDGDLQAILQGKSTLHQEGWGRDLKVGVRFYPFNHFFVEGEVKKPFGNPLNPQRYNDDNDALSRISIGFFVFF